MNDKKDPIKEEKAQLKKLMESHMAVLEHKLGRPPTMEELMDFASEKPEGSVEPLQKPHTEESEKEEEKTEGTYPSILDMLVYYGMNGDGENRKPDPNKILFYRTPDNRWYDTKSQSWCDMPSHADHLPSRNINFDEKDIVSAIAHGVMEDSDYESLDKAGMIGDLPKQLWSRVKKLNNLTEQLEKSDGVESDEVPGENSNEDEKNDYGSEAFDADNISTGGADAVREFLKTAGVEASVSEDGKEELRGENLIEQIMQAAMAAVSSAMGENFEQQVSDIVHRILEQYGIIELIEEEKIEHENQEDENDLTYPDEME